MPDAKRSADGLPALDTAAVNARTEWITQARPNQLPPRGLDWDTLLWLCGRFYGKTRCLSEIAWWECWRWPNLRWHALAPTIGDVRRTVFEGESGLLARCPRELVKDYNRSLHEMTLTNGSRIIGFSMTEEADRLRGPQCHGMSVDEAAAADRPPGNLQQAYEVASLGCRLPHPDGVTPARTYIATTPRPIEFLRKLLKRPRTIVVRGTSYENFANVAASMRPKVAFMEGTRFARQEIHGDILDATDGAIFQRSWFRLWPYRDRLGQPRKLPEFNFICMTMDTAFEEENYDAKKGNDPDYSACAVLGVFNVHHVFNEEERKRHRIRAKYAAVVCDFWMERLGFPELLEKARKTYRTKYGGENPRYPDIVLIEKKASGISLRQTLMQYGVPTWPYDPKRMGKTERANAASPYVLQGHLWVPESSLPQRVGEPRDWIEPLLEQMCAYQGEGSTEHDDGLDCVTQAVLHLAARGLFHVEPSEKAFPDLDEKEEAEQRRAMAEYERQKRGAQSIYGA